MMMRIGVVFFDDTKDPQNLRWWLSVLEERRRTGRDRGVVGVVAPPRDTDVHSVATTFMMFPYLSKDIFDAFFPKKERKMHHHSFRTLKRQRDDT